MLSIVWTEEQLSPEGRIKLLRLVILLKVQGVPRNMAVVSSAQDPEPLNNYP